MSPEEYVQGAMERMRSDGSEVSVVSLPGGQAAVGYQSEFRLRWMATKLHLFTVVTTMPTVDAAALDQLTDHAVRYAKDTKGALRGLQVGVAVIPVAVSEHVTPEGIDRAQARPDKGFAAFTLPAAVDVSSGSVHGFRGRMVWGAVYSGWLHARRDAVVGPPTR